MWIVSHEEIAAGSKFAARVQRTLGHVVANTEGGRKVIGRWNRPTDFDHLVGDLLDMSRPGAVAADRLGDRSAPRALGGARFRRFGEVLAQYGQYEVRSGAGETSASVLGRRTAGVRRALRADGSRSEVVLGGQCIAANSREHLPTPQNLPQRASSGRLEVAWKSLQRYRGRLEVTRLRG